jgi:hypothetical protein
MPRSPATWLEAVAPAGVTVATSAASPITDKRTTQTVALFSRGCGDPTGPVMVAPTVLAT